MSGRWVGDEWEVGLADGSSSLRSHLKQAAYVGINVWVRVSVILLPRRISLPLSHTWLLIGITVQGLLSLGIEEKGNPYANASLTLTLIQTIPSHTLRLLAASSTEWGVRMLAGRLH